MVLCPNLGDFYTQGVSRIWISPWSVFMVEKNPLGMGPYQVIFNISGTFYGSFPRAVKNDAHPWSGLPHFGGPDMSHRPQIIGPRRFLRSDFLDIIGGLD